MVVGCIGVGRMGLPICATLVRAGHDVVAADIDGSRAQAVRAAGARWAQSAASAASAADVLLTVLPGPAELRSAMGGALAAMRPGTVWIDLTSATPAEARELGSSATAGGIDRLEAPMGGGPAQAAEGRLQLFVGGPASVLARQRGLLECLGNVEHVGGHGHGYAAKLLVNLLWFGQAVAAAEAFLLARKAGLDLDVFRDAVSRSSAASKFIDRDLGAVLEGDYYDSFGLDRCCEELEGVAALAAGLEAPFELSSCVVAEYERALARYGPADGELLGVALKEEQAGIRLRRGVDQRLHPHG